MFLFFFYFLDTLFLHCDNKPCIHFLCIYIYIYILRFLLQFHLSLFVCVCVCFFFFFFNAHVSYILYAIFYFYFTLRCRDVFYLKYFRNTGCQSLPCYELTSCKVFQELVL